MVPGAGAAVRARANSQLQHQASSLLPNIDKKATIAFSAGAVRPGRESNYLTVTPEVGRRRGGNGC